MSSSAISMTPFEDENRPVDKQILESIFHVLPLVDLCNWRLVNKTYNQIACNNLRLRLTWATLGDDNAMNSFINAMSNRLPDQPIPVNAFSLVLPNISPDNIVRFIGIVNGDVQGYEFTELGQNGNISQSVLFHFEVVQLFAHNQIMAKMLALLGSSHPVLETLTLKSEMGIPMSALEILRFPIVFPNLKTIEYELNVSDPDDPNEFLLVLVQRCPNLKTLKLTVSESTVPAILEKVPDLLFGIPRDTPPALHLNASVANDHIGILEILIQHEYNLLKEIVFLFYQEGEEEALWEAGTTLLNFQAQSLELLILSFYYPQNTFRIQFPTLLKLRCLSIFVPEREAIRSAIVPWTETLFPALEELSLGEINLNFFNWLPDVILPKLERLSVWEIVEIPSRVTGPIVSWHLNFPNLQSIQFHFTPCLTVLEYVFHYLTQIKTLDLGINISQDDIPTENVVWKLFTGRDEPMPQSELIELREDDRVESTHGHVNEDQGTLVSYYPITSLGNFKNLRELRLWIRTLPEMNAIVYMSRPGGLPQLDILSIGLPPNLIQQLQSQFEAGMTDPEESEELSTVRETESNHSGNGHVIYFNPTPLPSHRSSIISGQSSMYFEYLTSVAQHIDGNEDDEEVTDTLVDDNDGLTMTFELMRTLSYPTQLSPSDSGIHPNLISIVQNYHHNLEFLSFY